MSRKTQVILSTVAAGLVLAGSLWLAVRRPALATSSGAGVTRTVADMTSRSVRIPAAPARILSLCASVTDTIVRLGQSARLAAIDEYGRIVPGAKHAVSVGKDSVLSREQILAKNIDLAFVWWYQDAAAKTLEDLSVPVVRVRGSRTADVPGMIRLVGDCLGLCGQADRLAARVEGRLRRASSRPVAAARTPRVYVELYGPFKTVGRDSYLNDLLDLAGAENVAGGACGSVLLSAERLIAADPDVILFVQGFSNRADIHGRPGMKELRAVREGRVLPMDRYWLVAGAGLPEAVGRLQAAIAGPKAEERQ